MCQVRCSAKKKKRAFTSRFPTCGYSGIGESTWSGSLKNAGRPTDTALETFVNNTYVAPTYFGYPPRPYNLIGYLDATTAPIRHRGVVAFATRRAKELGADAIIVLSDGTQYAGAISTGSAFTSGQFDGSGFNAMTTAT